MRSTTDGHKTTGCPEYLGLQWDQEWQKRGTYHATVPLYTYIYICIYRHCRMISSTFLPLLVPLYIYIYIHVCVLSRRISLCCPLFCIYHPSHRPPILFWYSQYIWLYKREMQPVWGANPQRNNCAPLFPHPDQKGQNKSAHIKLPICLCRYFFFSR